LHRELNCGILLAFLKRKGLRALSVGLEDVDGGVADNAFPACLADLIDEE
jgi:hypothetical protein